VKISIEIFRKELNNVMDYSKFDLLVNKILGESMQSGGISSTPKSSKDDEENVGVGKTDSNTPPSSEPEITTAAKIPSAPEVSSVTMPNTSETDIKAEILKLPTDVQAKMASAKTVPEIMNAIANVDPTSKQKIENYIKTMYSGSQTQGSSMQNLPPLEKNQQATV
jgi:hypothetical protein